MSDKFLSARGGHSPTFGFNFPALSLIVPQAVKLNNNININIFFILIFFF